jgi:hypothetical protein
MNYDHCFTGRDDEITIGNNLLKYRHISFRIHMYQDFLALDNCHTMGTHDR